jgi:predicted amidophosphoribosyltransferase
MKSIVKTCLDSLYTALRQMKQSKTDNTDDNAKLCEECGHWFDSSKSPCPECFPKPSSIHTIHYPI